MGGPVGFGFDHFESNYFKLRKNWTSLILGHFGFKSSRIRVKE